MSNKVEHIFYQLTGSVWKSGNTEYLFAQIRPDEYALISLKYGNRFNDSKNCFGDPDKFTWDLVKVPTRINVLYEKEMLDLKNLMIKAYGNE